MPGERESKDINDVITSHWKGNLSGYKSLLNLYLENVVPSNTFSRLESEGWSFYTGKDGRQMAGHPQYGESTLIAMKKAGLL